MRIDGHQHFWKPSRGDYHWMSEDMPVLYRDYLPKDIQPELTRHSIDRTIVVQAAQTTEETDFLLDLAAQNEIIAGVVGWLDLESDSFEQQLKTYRKNPKFVGLRPMLQDIEDPAWIVQPQVLQSLQIMANADVPIDFLTQPRHLPYVLKALDKVPNLRGVIDHISKPEIRTHTLEPWQTLMKEVAARGLYCKLSGMITEADHMNWSARDLRPYVQHVISCFGWDRVIFGSDWPVCLLAGTYSDVVQVLKDALDNSPTPDAERKLFGKNAVRFYKLPL